MSDGAYAANSLQEEFTSLRCTLCGNECYIKDTIQCSADGCNALFCLEVVLMAKYAVMTWQIIRAGKEHAKANARMGRLFDTDASHLARLELRTSYMTKRCT